MPDDVSDKLPHIKDICTDHVEALEVANVMRRSRHSVLPSRRLAEEGMNLLPSYSYRHYIIVHGHVSLTLTQVNLYLEVELC